MTVLPKLFGLETLSPPILATDVIPLLRREKARKDFLIDDVVYNLNVGSLRLMCFKHSNKCVTCNRVGSVFIVQRHNEIDAPHFNLFHVGPKGGLLMMTRDHIVPRSKGGADSMANSQTMCYSCNQKKGDECTIVLPQIEDHVDG